MGVGGARGTGGTTVIVQPSNPVVVGGGAYGGYGYNGSDLALGCSDFYIHLI